MLWKQSSNGWEPVNHPKDRRVRRQDMESEVYETGAAYVFQLDAFRLSGYRFCSAPKPVLESGIISIDIDSHIDLLLAEIVLSHRELKSSLESKS